MEVASILKGRNLYIPRMTYGGAKAFAAAVRSVGINGQLSPESSKRTLELAKHYTSGDECYPQQVTLGEFLQVMRSKEFVPKKTAFFMPTAGGPCRFGQYATYMKRLLRDFGYQEAIVVSPASDNSYDELGKEAGAELMRTGWRALVSADILRKMLLKTRPYELNKGDTDRAYEESLDLICQVLEKIGVRHKDRLAQLVDALTKARHRFRSIPARYDKSRPLIGVVGEIFCRLNRFSNDELIRIIEEQGGEVWLSDVSEWLWYTNWDQIKHIIRKGKKVSLEMLGAKLKNYIQKKDEHALLEPFKEDFQGYEEPEHVEEVLNYSKRYLPPRGCLGEMVLSTGKAIYLYEKGADGIVDISPFTCMNGITCEAVYPNLSRDHDGLPIRIFYFDGTQSNLDRDMGIFLELAKSYQRRKKKNRVYPFCFN
ncbi:hypothetical protein CEE39_08015 [bacterium (candidate division B38) B3_B38]|nr:MAG: hypothetical protein CEE39_08015 [bacterium (candidate division B38) B3_B38]